MQVSLEIDKLLNHFRIHFSLAQNETNRKHNEWARMTIKNVALMDCLSLSLSLSVNAESNSHEFTHMQCKAKQSPQNVFCCAEFIRYIWLRIHYTLRTLNVAMPMHMAALCRCMCVHAQCEYSVSLVCSFQFVCLQWSFDRECTIAHCSDVTTHHHLI